MMPEATTPHQRNLVDWYEFIDPWGIDYLSHFPSLVLVFEVLALLWLAKKAFDLFHPFELEHQLVKVDNKAITLAFVGYLAGVASFLEFWVHLTIKGRNIDNPLRLFNLPKQFLNKGLIL